MKLQSHKENLFIIGLKVFIYYKSLLNPPPKEKPEGILNWMFFVYYVITFKKIKRVFNYETDDFILRDWRFSLLWDTLKKKILPTYLIDDNQDHCHWTSSTFLYHVCFARTPYGFGFWIVLILHWLATICSALSAQLFNP